MNFKRLCELIATNAHIDTDETDLDIDPSVKSRMDVLISNVKPKLHVLDKTEFKYIENVFTMPDDVLHKALRDSCNFDIPDGIINHLSMSLYDKTMNALTVSEQSIIKVLAVYLMI